MAKWVYAVAKGHQTGVYSSWEECRSQVTGYTGAVFRKFATELEAKAFIDQHHDSNHQSSSQGGGEAGATSISALRIKKEMEALKASNQAMRSTVVLLMDGLDENNARIEKLIQNMSTLEGKRGIVEASSSEPPGKRPCPSASEATTTHENGLHRDDEGYVHVYTDGSCENNGRSGARAGYGIWWADNHPLNRGEAAAKPTNNAAEIEAASQAVKLASKAGITKLRIFTDSKFTIQCVTSWMPSWKRNGWKTAKNEPVKNQKELEDLDCALKQGNIKVAWEHVKGHAGNHGNEQADTLARSGAAKYAKLHLGGL